jgi:predicted NBD/HSP70 family sugar kinase
VGVAGLVDADGVVRMAPNLDWRNVPLRDALTKALDDPGYPVTVDNDANLSAQAEHRFGPHAGIPDLVYLDGRLGVGAGIISAGQLLRGGRGYSGEIGHVQIDPAGPACACGRRGCLEVFSGVGALIRKVAGIDGQDEIDLDPEVADVIRRAQAGEPAVLKALDELGRHVGQGAAIMANVANPDVVVLGGYYVPLAPWILAVAEAELRSRSVAPDTEGCRLFASTLGHGAAAIGGAASVLDVVDPARLPALAP